jgi:hypothetical protein
MESTVLNSLFAPLVLTPEQYYDNRRNDTAVRPIKRLMLAILEDALWCLHHHADAKNGEPQLLYREAERWFSQEDQTALLSFNLCCETLGIEPDYLRSSLRRWRETQSHNGHPRLGRRAPAARDRAISPRFATRGEG